MSLVPRQLLYIGIGALATYGIYRFFTRAPPRTLSKFVQRYIEQVVDTGDSGDPVIKIKTNANGDHDGDGDNENTGGGGVEQKDVFPSVTLAKFSSHCESQRTKVEGEYDHYDVEMEVLNKLAQQMIKHRLYSPPARGKDRYINVLPFDENRVKLSASSSTSTQRDDSADYINASYISREGHGQASYVAAQAPVPAMIPSFWRMIWERKSSLVVMLTRETESNHEKASRYWPEYEHGEQRYGSFVVKPLKTAQRDADVIVRTFQLTFDNTSSVSSSTTTSTSSSAPPSPSSSPLPSPSSGTSILSAAVNTSSDFLTLPTLSSSVSTSTERRSSDASTVSSPTSSSSPPSTMTVTHIQYIGWPDFGTPTQFTSFHQLMTTYRTQRDARDDSRAPVVVHCSAGIGRTGTLIALDKIWDDIQHVKRVSKSGSIEDLGTTPINVFKTVFRLRQQRAGMVQTRAQYEFIFAYLDFCWRKHLF